MARCSTAPPSTSPRGGRSSRARSVPYSRAEFDRTFGWRNPEILRELLDPNLGDDECRALGEEKETAYRDLVRRGAVRLLPGVRELLDGFRALGVPQAVGSSAPAGNLELLLSSAGVAGYFGAVVSGDDVKRGKPDPEVFALGAAKLGVPPGECLVVEDAVAGVQAARAAGMACLAVLSGHHHTAESLTGCGGRGAGGGESRGH